MKLIACMSKLVVLALIALSTFSCGGSEDNPVTFKVRSGTTMLIPTATTTCKEEAEPTIPATQSLAKSYFRFETPQVEFDNEKVLEIAKKTFEGATLANVTFNIIGFTMKMNSANVGGAYSCIIAGDELKYLYYKGTAYWDPVNISYDAVTSTFKSSNYYTTQGYTSCSLKCGGVEAKEVSFTATVSMEALVVMSVTNPQNGSVVDIPYKASSSAIIRNIF